MFRAVAKLKMIECSFSAAILPFSSSFCCEGREGRQSFSFGRQVSKLLFQSQCHLMSQQDTFSTVLERGNYIPPGL